MQLVLPSIAYKEAMLEAAGEMHACGEWEITPEALGARFDTLVQELAAARDPATAPAGVLPYLDYWLLEDTTWIGLLTLRPNITAELMRSGGHIGYVIRPSRRRQGYGTALLRLGLEQARSLGLTQVLLTCADTNLGSRKVIEANGGRLEDVVQIDVDTPPVRRYWITLAAADD
ncbi:MAG TPA: GNAT family N-acetyltransferase [Anaerolineales bacterium]|nr:GNAT family N-acetyltransferase [Anaerolineales bacterium]